MVELTRWQFVEEWKDLTVSGKITNGRMVMDIPLAEEEFDTFAVGDRLKLVSSDEGLTGRGVVIGKNMFTGHMTIRAFWDNIPRRY